MKKNFLRVSACVALLGLAASASASPILFQIGGSELDIVGLGFGDYEYHANSGSLLLDEGESQPFDFGFVDVSAFAGGGGLAQLTVQLLSPTVDGGVASIGAFGIAAAFDFGTVGIEWFGPATVSYSWGGLSGGSLSVDMFDVAGFYHDGFTLSGRITNVRAPVAVSEPGILLLLGSGLLATALVRRRASRRT